MHAIVSVTGVSREANEVSGEQKHHATSQSVVRNPAFHRGTTESSWTEIDVWQEIVGFYKNHLYHSGRTNEQCLKGALEAFAIRDVKRLREARRWRWGEVRSQIYLEGGADMI